MLWYKYVNEDHPLLVKFLHREVKYFYPLLLSWNLWNSTKVHQGEPVSIRLIQRGMDKMLRTGAYMVSQQPHWEVCSQQGWGITLAEEMKPSSLVLPHLYPLALSPKVELIAHNWLAGVLGTQVRVPWLFSPLVTLREAPTVPSVMILQADPAELLRIWQFYQEDRPVLRSLSPWSQTNFNYNGHFLFVPCLC